MLGCSVCMVIGFPSAAVAAQVGSGTDLPGAQWLCFARLAVAALRSKKPVLKARGSGCVLWWWWWLLLLWPKMNNDQIYKTK